MCYLCTLKYFNLQKNFKLPKHFKVPKHFKLPVHCELPEQPKYSACTLTKQPLASRGNIITELSPETYVYYYGHVFLRMYMESRSNMYVSLHDTQHW